MEVPLVVYLYCGPSLIFSAVSLSENSSFCLLLLEEGAACKESDGDCRLLLHGWRS